MKGDNCRNRHKIRSKLQQHERTTVTQEQTVGKW